MAKGGRPPLPNGVRKSETFTFRTRPSMRASLEAAAVEAGRSISEEIEYRLSRSFDREEVVRITLDTIAERLKG